mmetsp:Transcript_96655/g.275893  ORF Transcript_96655/g.275893 Transcript_96655/m.275893 type:complete len:300 (-) Transcript_96655:306-1205(-)
MAHLPRSNSSKKRMSRVGSKSSIVRHDIHSAASGRAVGETAVARSTGGGGGFWSGFTDSVFGKKELEIPEEVATDRANYIQDVKDVLMEKEGMVPGHTYQGDLKERFKELMRKNPEFRTLTGPQLLDTLVRLSPDENPFRGDRYDRLQMRIQEQVKEVQIAKLSRKYEASTFAARTGAAPTLPSRSASNVAKSDRAVSADAATPSNQGMRGVEGRNRAQTVSDPRLSVGGGHARQRSIKFADEVGSRSMSRSMSMAGEEEDTVGDLPPSAKEGQGGGFSLTRMFSQKGSEPRTPPLPPP